MQFWSTPVNVLKAVFKENVSGIGCCARHQLESDEMQLVKSWRRFSDAVPVGQWKRSYFVFSISSPRSRLLSKGVCFLSKNWIVLCLFRAASWSKCHVGGQMLSSVVSVLWVLCGIRICNGEKKRIIRETHGSVPAQVTQKFEIRMWRLCLIWCLSSVACFMVVRCYGIVFRSDHLL